LKNILEIDNQEKMENLIKKLMELRELAMNMSNLYVIKELKKYILKTKISHTKTY